MQITFTTHLTHLIVNEIESEYYNFKFILEKWEIIGVNEFIKDKVFHPTARTSFFHENKSINEQVKLIFNLLRIFWWVDDEKNSNFQYN